MAVARVAAAMEVTAAGVTVVAMAAGEGGGEGGGGLG
jgi:hypothetical protein